MESVEDESEAKKFCGKCKKLVPVKDFHKAKHTRDGLRHTCRHCLKIYHSERYKKQKKISKKTGTCLCAGCSNKTEKGATFCPDHFFRQSARRTLEDASLTEDIKKIAEKQNYICPLTGDVLKAGVNMSLDHIKPTSKYPHLLKKISNLQWLSKWANWAKGTSSMTVFINNCTKVFKNAAKENRNKSKKDSKRRR